MLPAFVTGVLLALYRGMPAKGERVLRAAAILAIFGVTFMVPIYSDTHIPPVTCELVWFCIPLVLLFVKPRLLCTVTTAAFTVLAVSNTSLYQIVSMRADVTLFSEQSYRVAEVVNVKRLANLLGQTVEGTHKEFPAGYVDAIRDPAIHGALATQGGSMYAVVESRVIPQWHTALTGMSLLETRPTRIWFDGGEMAPNPSLYHAVGIGAFHANAAQTRSWSLFRED